MNNYENLINKMLDGRYKLTGIRGIGGMAVVYEADDIAMNRKVAVKMLKDEIKEDVQEVKRFINESKAVAMLSHPNIVHIYDVSVKNSEHRKYIVMELIDGITLKDYIVKKGGLNWREAISYSEQILSALQHAHSRGIIHRDIKPQNIMLLRNGNLKVTDFGIAKMRDSEPLTMTDKAIGTVHYISPEQANGARVTNVSDIYSTGILLYEMTTGQLPFEGDTAINVAMKQINETPKNPRDLNPEIPKGLSQIILKAVSKAPQDRYQSAGDMIKQLSILSANPAVVFNINNANPNDKSNVNGNARNPNLPIVLGNSKDIEASRNGKKTALEAVNNKNIKDVDNIDEAEMRRRGRMPQKNIKRKGSRSWLPVISGATIAFLIVLGFSAVNIIMKMAPIFDPDAVDAATVIIPNYAGKLLDDNLKSEMKAMRLTVGNITYKTNDSYGKNQIITQSPPAGRKKKFASDTDTIAVDFTISQGKDTYLIPDLSIREFRDVELELKTKRLTVIRVPEPNDTVPKGYVIYTDPMQGVLLNSGDTIYVHESTGQEVKKVMMPNVVGLTEKEARKMLSAAQIIIKEIKSVYSDSMPPGYISDQSIIASTEVPRKSTKVTLEISIGAAPGAVRPESTETNEVPPEELTGAPDEAPQTETPNPE